MKKVLLGFCLLGAAGGAYLWWSSAERADEAVTRTLEDNNSAASLHNSDNPERHLAHSPTEPHGQLRQDAVVITPCNILPAQEQTVSSQVDGILEEIRVQLGDTVPKGAILGRLYDRQIQAQTDLLKIRATSESALRIAQAQHDEADGKVTYAIKANESGLQSVPDLEYKTYLFQRDRFAHEIKKAREEQGIARKELEKTLVLLEQHQIQSGMAGEVVKVFKRPGESVKQAEPLFRLVDSGRLRIEGLCKAQQADLLRVGMTALVEPDARGEQLTELTGHTAPITGLTQSPDSRLLASASEDRSVIIWSWPQAARLCTLPHPAEVTTLAFAPAGAADQGIALITGSSDGQLRRWLVMQDGLIKPATTFADGHAAAVRCVAFSVDGTWCASGGDDRRIGLWDAAAGKLLYWLEAESGGAAAHTGGVTSLSFTADGSLVSMGRDQCLKVWKIKKTAAQLIDQVSGRTGEVTQFSLSPDGKTVLFDHGEELRVLDRTTWDAVGALRSQRQGRFAGFAHVSPSGKLILTAASNGRVQVWRAPVPTARPDRFQAHSYEVRHFVPPTAVPITCGLFTQDERVCLTAGVDKVIRVWPAPSPSEWQSPLQAKITYIGSQVERGTDTVRIRAELENPREPARRLRLGTFATLRIFAITGKERAADEPAP